MKEYRERFYSRSSKTKLEILVVIVLVPIIFVSVSLLLPKDFTEPQI